MGAAVVDGKIYTMGGYGEWSEVTQTNFVFDIAQDLWTTNTKMPTARSNLAVVALDDKIYALGGNSGEEKAEVFDPKHASWRAVAPLPSPRIHLNGSAVTCKGKIYVLGGAEEWYVVSDKNEVYDPDTDSWKALAPMPTPRQSVAAAVVDDKIFAIGGHGDYAPFMLGLTIVESYDPVANTWERKADLPESGFPVGAVVIDARILVLIQTGFGKDEASKIFAYNIEKDTWSEYAEVPRAVRLAGLAAFQNNIYIIGGGNSREIFTDIIVGTVLDSDAEQKPY
jgi:N-acetylneuraminic acid mutarotase